MKFSIIIIIAGFLFISCETKNNNKDLSEEFYNVLLNYQKSNPLPTKENSNKTSFLISKNLKHVYEATFYKDSVYVTLNPSGINVEENSYGIYKDKILKATYIIDDNKIGKAFVKRYLIKDLENYILIKPPIIDVIYPTYIYAIKQNKLVLSDSLRGNIHK